MSDSDTVYLTGFISVLRKRDVVELREFLKQEAALRDPARVAEIESMPDEDLETRMYKMILARPELRDLHPDARRWLRDHGKDVRFG